MTRFADSIQQIYIGKIFQKQTENMILLCWEPRELVCVRIQYISLYRETRLRLSSEKRRRRNGRKLYSFTFCCYARSWLLCINRSKGWPDVPKKKTGPSRKSWDSACVQGNYVFIGKGTLGAWWLVYVSSKTLALGRLEVAFYLAPLRFWSDGDGNSCLKMEISGCPCVCDSCEHQSCINNCFFIINVFFLLLLGLWRWKLKWWFYYGHAAQCPLK